MNVLHLLIAWQEVNNVTKNPPPNSYHPEGGLMSKKLIYDTYNAQIDTERSIHLAQMIVSSLGLVAVVYSCS